MSTGAGWQPRPTAPALQDGACSASLMGQGAWDHPHLLLNNDQFFPRLKNIYISTQLRPTRSTLLSKNPVKRLCGGGENWRTEQCWQEDVVMLSFSWDKTESGVSSRWLSRGLDRRLPWVSCLCVPQECLAVERVLGLTTRVFPAGVGWVRGWPKRHIIPSLNLKWRSSASHETATSAEVRW